MILNNSCEFLKLQIGELTIKRYLYRQKSECKLRPTLITRVRSYRNNVVDFIFE